jgi:hypothetical protein
MGGESPAVAPGDQGPQRRGIGEEHEGHVDYGEPDEDPDRPKVPVAGGLEPAEGPGEPGKLNGLVNRDAGAHREDADHDDAGIGELL